jgi:hypothetical protein
LVLDSRKGGVLLYYGWGAGIVRLGGEKKDVSFLRVTFLGLGGRGEVGMRRREN